MLSTALPFPGALTAASRDFVHLHVSQSHDLGEIATRSLHIELFFTPTSTSSDVTERATFSPLHDLLPARPGQSPRQRKHKTFIILVKQVFDLRMFFQIQRGSTGYCLCSLKGTRMHTDCVLKSLYSQTEYILPFSAILIKSTSVFQSQYKDRYDKI